MRLFLLLVVLLAGRLPPLPAAPGKEEERRRRQTLHRLAYRRDPAAGERLLAILAGARSEEVRRLSLAAVRRVLPFHCLPELVRLARAGGGREAGDLAELTAYLEAARAAARPGPGGRPECPDPADLAALRAVVGPRLLSLVVLDLDGRPLPGALVRVWSPRTACWHPVDRRNRPIYAKTDGQGRVRLEAPPGGVVAAAWTPRLLLWREIGPGEGPGATLRPDTRLRVVEQDWSSPTGRVEAWPAGPWPTARFPAWLVQDRAALFVAVDRERPLDLLVMSSPQGRVGSCLFLRRVGKGRVRFPRTATLRAGGEEGGEQAAVVLHLAPRLRPDLERPLRLPHPGAGVRVGAGRWRVHLQWRRRGWGTLTSFPLALTLRPDKVEHLPLHPLRGSVYARREARLGDLVDALSARLLLRTPGGAVVRSITRRGAPVRGRLELLAGSGEGGGAGALDGSFRYLREGAAPAGWCPGRAHYRAVFPFGSFRLRGLEPRIYESEHFSLEGPLHLDAKAHAIMTMAELSLQGMLELTERRPTWRQVPLISHNHMPPGFLASAAGGGDRRGRLDFHLHSFLSLALPADLMELPWLHELGHKLGFRHGPAMEALLVESAYALLGREGLRCTGAYGGEKVWRFACGERRRPPYKARLQALVLLRRLCGPGPLRRYLAQERRLHWYLEGEGISQEAAAVAALTVYAGRELAGWFRALGWRLPPAEMARAARLLARAGDLPPAEREEAEEAFRVALAAGRCGPILARLMAIREHLPRARAALRALRERGDRAPEREVRALVRLAQEAAAKSTEECWLRTRSEALGMWADRVTGGGR